MQILNPDNTLSYQHFDIADECHALSESTYNQITGQNISLDPDSSTQLQMKKKPLTIQWKMQHFLQT